MARDYAIIVGFGPGNGLGIARAMGRRGLSLALLSRDPAKHRDHVHSLIQDGATAEAFEADASYPESLTASITRAKTRFGGAPAVLVYNVTARAGDPLHTISPAQFAADLRVDAVGAVASAQAVLPEMRARRSGTILLTGGGWALYPTASAPSPSVGKAALRAAALVLNEELRGSGVRVGTVTVMGMVKRGSEVDPDRIGQAFADLLDVPDADFPAETRLPAEAGA